MSQFGALILFDVGFFDIIVAYSFIILNSIMSGNIGLSTICLVNMQPPWWKMKTSYEGGHLGGFF